MVVHSTAESVHNCKIAVYLDLNELHFYLEVQKQNICYSC